MGDEELEEIMGQLSGHGEITKDQCLYLMNLYESRNKQLVQVCARIKELQAEVKRLRAKLAAVEKVHEAMEFHYREAMGWVKSDNLLVMLDAYRGALTQEADET